MVDFVASKVAVRASQSQAASPNHECYFFEGTDDKYLTDEQGRGAKKMVQKFFEVVSQEFRSFHVDGPCEAVGVAFGIGEQGMLPILNGMLDQYKAMRDSDQGDLPSIHVMGHSRGAVIAMMFIQEITLYHYNKGQNPPQIYLYAHDPVTGPLNENWVRELGEHVKPYFVLHSDGRQIMGSTISPLNITCSNEEIFLLPGKHTAGIAGFMAYSIPEGVHDHTIDESAARQMTYSFFYQHMKKNLGCPKLSWDQLTVSPRSHSQIPDNILLDWDNDDASMHEHILKMADLNFSQAIFRQHETMNKWVEGAKRPYVHYLPMVWQYCPQHIRSALKASYPAFYQYFFEFADSLESGASLVGEACIQAGQIKDGYPNIYNVLEYLDMQNLKAEPLVVPPREQNLFWRAAAVIQQYELMVNKCAKDENKQAVQEILRDLKHSYIENIRQEMPVRAALQLLSDGIEYNKELINKYDLKLFTYKKGLYRRWFAGNVEIILKGRVYLPGRLSQLVTPWQSLANDVQQGICCLSNRTKVNNAKRQLNAGAHAGYQLACRGIEAAMPVVKVLGNYTVQYSIVGAYGIINGSVIGARWVWPYMQGGAYAAGDYMRIFVRYCYNQNGSLNHGYDDFVMVAGNGQQGVGLFNDLDPNNQLQHFLSGREQLDDSDIEHSHLAPHPQIEEIVEDMPPESVMPNADRQAADQSDTTMPLWMLAILGAVGLLCMFAGSTLMMVIGLTAVITAVGVCIAQICNVFSSINPQANQDCVPERAHAFKMREAARVIVSKVCDMVGVHSLRSGPAQ